MQTYARIRNGAVAELFVTDLPITELFFPALLWVDVTARPEVAVGWGYDGSDFVPPVAVAASDAATVVPVAAALTAAAAPAAAPVVPAAAAVTATAVPAAAMTVPVAAELAAAAAPAAAAGSVTASTANTASND